MQHGASTAARGRSAGEHQSGQATVVLDRKSASLVHQRGGGVPATQHRRRGAASAGPASAAREQAALVAADVKLPSRLSAAALSAGRTVIKQKPAQLKAAYNHRWTNFRRWSALRSGYRRSAMMSSTTSSHTGCPSLPNSGSWMARSWRRQRLNSSSWRRTTLFSGPHLLGPARFPW
jgi:hypothetical protein